MLLLVIRPPGREAQLTKLRTNLLQRIYWLSCLIDESNFERIQRLVLNLVSGPKSHNFHVVLHCHFAQDTIRILSSLGAERKGVFAFPVNRNAPNLIPWFSNKLNSYAVVCGRRYVLVLIRVRDDLYRQVQNNVRLALSSNHQTASQWFSHWQPLS